MIFTKRQLKLRDSFNVAKQHLLSMVVINVDSVVQGAEIFGYIKF